MNNSQTNKYAQKYMWNGEPLSSLYIPFRKVTEGGTLRVEMGSEPKDQYGN